MMGGGGGGGQTTSTVTQNSDPWGGIQEQLKQGVGDISRLYSGGSAPSYNMTGYNAALKAWQDAGGSANAGPRMNEEEFQGSKGYTGRGSWAKYATDSKTASNSPMPTLEQFLNPGSGDPNAPSLMPKYFPTSTIAGQSPETEQALQMQIDRAQTGSPLIDTAKNYTQGMLNGDYLSPDSNPYLKSYVDQSLDDVQGRVNSSFSAGGRGGSGINQEVLTRELGKTANNAYGQAYESERGRQQQGLLFAPQLANQDYYDIGQLASAGNTKDQRSQDFLNEDINRFNFDQQAPIQNIQQYLGLLNNAGGNYGSKTGTTTEPYYGGGGGANALGLLGSLGGSMMGGGGGMLGGLGGLISGGLGGGSFNPISLMAGLPWSDSRLKENIYHVGFENNIPIYHFNYINDPHKARWRGVMAQDVVSIMPQAVGIKDGYATVDYDMIGIEPRKLH